jgi:Zn-finger nucleic acid-binding protein
MRNDVDNSRTRIPCPVCLGVAMSKIRPEGNVELWLDHCPRCGGIWFDEGEVEMLRAAHPRSLATKVRISEAASRMQCHSCHASMARNLSKCTACGWKNVLDCPRCEKPLEPIQRNGLKIDVCKSCHGAWFDNSELAEIWNRSVTASANRQGILEPAERDYAGGFILETLFWSSMFHGHSHGASVATDVAGAGASGIAEGVAGAGIGEVAGGVVGGIGDVAGSVVDSVGDAAGGFFDSVADIFGSIDF